MNTNDQPAFPCDLHGVATAGMTLRDYFAAHVMAGDWAVQNSDVGAFNSGTETASLRSAARLYYRMADAMLAVRNEQGENK